MTFWTPERLALAEQVIGRHTNYTEAIEELQELLGFKITKHALQKAFLRAGMFAPRDILGSTVQTEDEVAEEEEIVPPSKARRNSVYPEDPQLEKLIREAKKGIGFEALANKLDVSPAKLQKLITQAQKEGFRIDIAHDTVGWKPTDEFDTEQKIPMLAKAGEYLCFAIASDLHIGSKHFMHKQLEDFVDMAYAAGCRNGLIPGDMLDGCMKFLMWEQTHRGLQEQAELAAQLLPQRPGWRWDWILGNHEESFEATSGIDVGQAVVAIFKDHGRNDLFYHGSRSAYVRLVSPQNRRGLLIEMHHPKGSPAYAVSYKPQRHIDQYPVGAKGDVLIQGHYHQSGYFTRRGVHALQAGTFQSGRSAFGKSLDGAPSTGGWIVRYALTPGGTVRRFIPEFVAYYDHEEVRDIDLG